MVRREVASRICGLWAVLSGLAWQVDGTPYGFGKVVKLGGEDRLIDNEFLRVYTADTVGFVFRMTHSAKNLLAQQPLEEASRYRVSANGADLGAVKVLGKYVHLAHMGHVPAAYTPRTFQATVFVRLPKPMVEGQKYTFKSSGLGGQDVDVTLTWSAKQVLSDAIKVNQIGYVLDAKLRLAYFGKWLGTAGAMDQKISEFSVLNLETGEVAFRGQAHLRHTAGQRNEGPYKSDFSGENVYGLDLSSINTPGAYCISVPGVGRSYSFRIDRDVMAEPLFTSIRALYHERCGIELAREHTPWVRNKCKMHGKIAMYPEYGPPLDLKKIEVFLKKGKTDGTLKYVKVKGGYHDAGDYVRRPMHIHIGEMLCSAYDLKPAAFIDEQFIIPESGNGIPDILDEAYFLLLYYLDTQWPDGGISAGSKAWANPSNAGRNAWMTNTDNEVTEYVMLPVSQLSCFDFAASAAHLGRLLKRFRSGKAKGQRLIAAAARAFDCGLKKFPPKDLNQEMLIAKAAARLMHATRDQRFADTLNALPSLKTKKIDYLNSIGFAFAYGSVPTDTPGLDQTFQQKVKQGVGGSFGWAINAFTMKKGYLHFKHPWAPIMMGSHSTRQAWWLALAWKLTGQRKFYDVLSASADVCLGANPMGQVQCSGLGQKHILHPLFLESMNDKLEEYLPGLWVYGPGRGTHWIFRTFKSCPPTKQIPDLYRFIDIDQCPAQAEFTVTETLAPAVVLFGALAPEHPKPYRGPLPEPK